MVIDSSVFGILNFEQFERFCEKLKVNPKEVKTNFDGWRKLILHTSDRLFAFPRDPKGVEWLNIELIAYEFLNKYENLPIPKFVARINDSKISFYEFAEVTRLTGIAYTKIEDKITKPELIQLQTDLAGLFSLWHTIPLEEVPSEIAERKMFDPIRYDFELRLLNPQTSKEAFEEVYDIIKVYYNENNFTQFKLLEQDKTESLWERVIEEIVNLEHVLIHGDIHEDQILIDSDENLKITGIIDWETVRIDNPVWEFNFGEWGYGVWAWWEDFPEIRREIWKTYLEKRNIKLTSLEGLNLIYTLFEFLIVQKPDMSLGTLIGKNQQESSEKCLERLCEITKKLEKEENY